MFELSIEQIKMVSGAGADSSGNNDWICGA